MIELSEVNLLCSNLERRDIMKKVLSLVLACTMLVLAVPVFASESSGVEKVLSSVKTRIGSTEQYDEFNSSTYEEDGKTEYSFYWNQSNGDYDSLNVSADEDGIIKQYNYYQGSKSYENKPKLKEVDETELYNKACEIANKLNPDLVNEIKIVKSNGYGNLSDGEAYFNIFRCVKGVELANEMGFMTISFDGQTLYDYSITYDKDIKFEDTTGIISKEEAKKAYTEQIGMTLLYDYEYKNDKIEAFPVYMPNEKYLEYIDAKTGKLTKYNDIYYFYEENASMNEAISDDYAVSSGEAGFTDVEVKELEGIKNLLSTQQIETDMRKNKVLNIPKAYTLKRIYGYSEEDEYFYNLTFGNEKSKEFISITANAETGSIKSIKKQRKSGKNKISDAQAQKIADDAVKELVPEIYAEYSLGNDAKDGVFNYLRMVNGIPFNADSIYIDIDMTNGNITWFSYDYHDDVDFPSIENALSEEEAIEKYFEQNEYKPYYILCCSKEKQTKFDKAALVYKFEADASHSIDALTGKKKSYTWEENEEYTDISGHYSENAVTALKNANIGYSGESFDPTKEITQKEFVAFAVSVLKQSSTIIIYDDYDYSYEEQQAKRFGIIDETYQPDAVVTRSDAAVMLAKAMGFNEIASIEEIFNCPFADVTNNIGQIAILSGLKIINGDGTGNFNPDKVLTRGDFAIILFNCLTK